MVASWHNAWLQWSMTKRLPVKVGGVHPDSCGGCNGTHYCHACWTLGKLHYAVWGPLVGRHVMQPNSVDGALQYVPLRGWFRRLTRSARGWVRTCYQALAKSVGVGGSSCSEYDIHVYKFPAGNDGTEDIGVYQQTDTVTLCGLPCSVQASVLHALSLTDHLSLIRTCKQLRGFDAAPYTAHNALAALTWRKVVSLDESQILNLGKAGSFGG